MQRSTFALRHSPQRFWFPGSRTATEVRKVEVSYSDLDLIRAIAERAVLAH